MEPPTSEHVTVMLLDKSSLTSVQSRPSHALLLGTRSDETLRVWCTICTVQVQFMDKVVDVLVVLRRKVVCDSEVRAEDHGVPNITPSSHKYCK